MGFSAPQLLLYTPWDCRMLPGLDSGDFAHDATQHLGQLGTWRYNHWESFGISDTGQAEYPAETGDLDWALHKSHAFYIFMSSI
jgi:hypothetical protein